MYNQQGARDFEEDVENGKRAEDLIFSRFNSVLIPTLQRVFYSDSEESRRLQKQGVDGYFKPVNTSFDVKVRDNFFYKYNDILLETIADRKRNTPGWLYKTNLVVYLWWNEHETGFVDGYLLFMDYVRGWFKGKESAYETKIAESIRNGSYWTTENKVVPIPDFPYYCIRRMTKAELMIPEPYYEPIKIKSSI